jgi:hypothetical protein
MAILSYCVHHWRDGEPELVSRNSRDLAQSRFQKPVSEQGVRCVCQFANWHTIQRVVPSTSELGVISKDER